MRHVLFACAAVALSAVPALADGFTTYADPPSARRFKCHIAAYGVGTFVNTKETTGTVTLDGLGSNGAGFGAGLGCDVSSGQFLAGVFADYTYNRADFTAALPATQMKLPFGNEMSFGIRAGVMPNRATLLYGLVGYTIAQGRDMSMAGGPVGLSVAFDGPRGVTLGGGIEVSLTPAVSMSLEYRHTTFDTSTGVMPVVLTPMALDTVENTVRVGLRYNFGNTQ